MLSTAQEAEEEVRRLKEYMLAIASAIFTFISIYTAILQPLAFSLVHQLASPPWDKILRMILLAPLLSSFLLTILLVGSMRFKLQYFTNEQAREQVKKFHEQYYQCFLLLSACSLLITIVIFIVIATALALYS